MSEESKMWRWVERWTMTPKSGRWDELVALMKEMTEQFTAPRGWRILTCKFGTGNFVEMETEWKGWDEHMRVWLGWRAQPVFDAFQARFAELTESKSIHEWWDLEE